jgi:hypothetical protein
LRTPLADRDASNQLERRVVDEWSRDAVDRQLNWLSAELVRFEHLIELAVFVVVSASAPARPSRVAPTECGADRALAE